jgi:ubiquinone/menaquinone biosynthesis C-methylase UbiE
VNFDRIARHYRWLEAIVFGNVLQRSRICWIDKVPRPARTLIVGEGNGRFLCELLRAHPGIEVDCMDASAWMLQLARERVWRTNPDSASRVRFFHRDVLNWSPSERYDLLVTHFFLDCFQRPALHSIVAKLARAAMPGATWLIADFTVPPGRFARLHAKLWLRAMYSFFRFATGIAANELIDPAACLQNNGFACDARKLFRMGMLKSELYRGGSHAPNLSQTTGQPG